MNYFELTNEQIEDIVRHSYQYVAMFNVNNKFALSQGGWNTVKVDKQLKDHTLKDIARPNNDTLYIGCLADLRADAVVINLPALNSKYVSLMITAYDHYVHIPLSTRLGNFKKPEKMLLYSSRTDGYTGESVEGIDHIYKTSGDFVSAVFRVMPHANEPERMKQIMGTMDQVTMTTLSEFMGKEAKPVAPIDFPKTGSDAEIFENNLLEVMQFVMNHTDFDPDHVIEKETLDLYKHLGIMPGRTYDPSRAVNGTRFREVAEQVAVNELAKLGDAEFTKSIATKLFHTKKRMTLDNLVLQSILGPIGQPANEAVYPSISTVDGKPMNALNDYVIHMDADQLPPATAFWSLTLYDTENGFFIPNDRKKYSVGENTGFQLDENGGITVAIAEQRPEGVPEDNWLPLQRGDYGIDIILRIYAPDLEKFKTWKPPLAKKLD